MHSIHFLVQFTHSVSDSVGHIPARSLRRPHNLHDLTFTHAEIPSDGVLTLDFWQLLSLGSVALEELVFLGVGQEHVSRDELMLRNVHKKLVLDEKLEVVRLVTFK